MKIIQIQNVYSRDSRDKREGYYGSYYRYEFCTPSGYWANQYDFDSRRKNYNVHRDEITIIGDFNHENRTS